MTAPISAIILAAGSSRRMEGQNKLLLPFGNKTILETVIEALLSIDLREIILVTGHEHEQVVSLVSAYPVWPVHNPDYRMGMAASIKTGVAALQFQDAGILICPGDMPFISPALVKKLAAVFRSAPEGMIVLPFSEGRHGHPVIFSPHFQEELLQIEGDKGARSLIQRHPEAVIKVPVSDSQIFGDIDTPEEYRKFFKS